MPYASIVFPLNVPVLYQYYIPESLESKVFVGCRVEVELKTKLYSGLVYEIHDDVDVIQENVNGKKIIYKPIINILDEQAVVTKNQLSLWSWISRYYCCSLGEVMEAGMPSGLKLNSESIIVKNFESLDDLEDEFLTNSEYLVAEALSIQKDLSIGQIQQILNRKSILPILKSLYQKNILIVREQLLEKYKPKTQKVFRIKSEFKNEDSYSKLYENLNKSDAQQNTFAALIELSENLEWATLSDLKEFAKTPTPALNALIKKGIVESMVTNISRIPRHTLDLSDLPRLSIEQQRGIDDIQKYFSEGKPVLLHGVTGSGKTRVYMEFIYEALAMGKQVLYMLPEIALTSQIVERLYEIFGNDILLYHSKINDYARVEIWQEVMKGRKLILSARSGVFLPFTNLDLIIVDEEHDVSYKQTSTNPLYNSRDIALFLANQFKAKIILGSATPSLESMYNAELNKFGLVKFLSRYGDVKLPKVDIVDLVYEKKTSRFKPVISVPLRNAIERELNAQKQIILFQNKRGYVPTIMCKNCGWSAVCKNCDVNLTYHKFTNELCCHYCNHKMRNPLHCPECGFNDVSEIGAGTEKIEELIASIFPKARLARLDFDAAKTKNAQDKIIAAFARGDTDILIGTQMVTKGFDFDKVSLVGIIDADSMIRFPNFRAIERTFQMITQVAGRAGRRADQGKVLIQTYSANHPVINEIMNHSYDAFYKREMFERNRFYFPPYVRIILIEIKHIQNTTVAEASNYIYKKLVPNLGKRVSEPIIPAISRIKNLYIRQILIKLEKDNNMIMNTKNFLIGLKNEMSFTSQFQSVRINIDVDAY